MVGALVTATTDLVGCKPRLPALGLVTSGAAPANVVAVVEPAAALPTVMVPTMPAAKCNAQKYG
jgi:hypothetical protein